MVLRNFVPYLVLQIFLRSVAKICIIIFFMKVTRFPRPETIKYSRVLNVNTEHETSAAVGKSILGIRGNVRQTAQGVCLQYVKVCSRGVCTAVHNLRHRYTSRLTLSHSRHVLSVMFTTVIYIHV